VDYFLTSTPQGRCKLRHLRDVLSEVADSLHGVQNTESSASFGNRTPFPRSSELY